MEIKASNDKKGMSDIDYFSSNFYVECFSNDMTLVDRCWDTYNECIEGREPDRDYNDIKTWFKQEEDVGSITMCGKTTINAPFMTVLSVFAEIDLMDTFIDSFEKVDALKYYSNFRLLTWSRLKMPLSFQNREILAKGIGIAVPTEKSVMIAMESIVDKEYLGTLVPPETNNYTRIQLVYGFYLITYIDENTCELTLATNVDPKIQIIPWFILNAFLKEVAYYIVLNFKTRIENIDKSIYEKRREKRSEFYDKIEKKIRFTEKK